MTSDLRQGSPYADVWGDTHARELCVASSSGRRGAHQECRRSVGGALHARRVGDLIITIVALVARGDGRSAFLKVRRPTPRSYWAGRRSLRSGGPRARCRSISTAVPVELLEGDRRSQGTPPSRTLCRLTTVWLGTLVIVIAAGVAPAWSSRASSIGLGLGSTRRAELLGVDSRPSTGSVAHGPATARTGSPSRVRSPGRPSVTRRRARWSCSAGPRAMLGPRPGTDPHQGRVAASACGRRPPPRRTPMGPRRT